MTPAVQQRLLELNRTFYATVATDFDQTRAGLPLGWQQLRRYLPLGTPTRPITVLDVGCGNGRFAHALTALGVHANYVGVDADASLLRLAAQHTAALDKIHARFVQADFAQADWFGLFSGATFDTVVCFAALHHFPGYALRLQIVKELTALCSVGGVLIFSNWQFLTSARFAQKQLAWQSVGLSEEDVEPGDALLPWQQGSYAVRYVHQIDETEMQRLADDAGLRVNALFYADGKEGNLNLYTILCRG